MQKILVVRSDKIGDLILTTPALKSLRKALPACHMDALVSLSTKPILENVSFVDDYFAYNELRYHGVIGFFRLVQKLKQQRYDAALVFFCQWHVALALFLAGIPKRVGIYSKIWSYLFLQRGIRQRRSQVEKHEAEYNLDLLALLGVDRTDEITEVLVSPSARQFAVDFFQNKPSSKPWLVIHPGMFGSALNWRTSQYIELGNFLHDYCHILVTGAPNERNLVEEVHRQIDGSFSYIGNEGLQCFMAVLDHCQAIVVGSTGPLHIANALGKKVFGIYPPVRVQSKERWGPYKNQQANVFSPQVSCPGIFGCIGNTCESYFCMDQISVEAVGRAIKDSLASH